jgi:vancomycin aglycone glucosyltransferase
MKFLLTPSGTQGEARPTVALCLGLKAKGHEVVVCSSPEHEQLFKKYDIEFYPAGLNLKERIKENPELASGNDMKSAKAQVKYFKEDFEAQSAGILKVAKGMDCIIDVGVSMAGRSVAEYYKIPYRHVLIIPSLLRTDNRIPFQFSDKKRSKLAIRMHWLFTDIVYNWTLRDSINKWRKKIGLAPIKNTWNFYTDYAIVATDEELGKVDPGVKTKYIQTGYWHLEEAAGELDKDLVSFIEAGSKPIYIGFGSIPDRDPEEVNRIFNELIGCKDYRFILSRSWGNMMENAKGENVKLVDYVPHTKLFPKLAAVIHHGGCGTVHTGALSGVPQIIIPYLPDHPYWGVKLNNLKMGPKHIMRTQLTAQKLLEAVREIDNTPLYKENAMKMAKTLSKKDSVNDAVDKIIEWIKKDG